MGDETLNNRTCATCACCYRIEPNRVATPDRPADPPNAKPVLICRLNPPTVIRRKDDTMGLSQAPTDAYFSCWHWKPQGTLPGESGVPYRVRN